MTITVLFSCDTSVNTPSKEEVVEVINTQKNNPNIEGKNFQIMSINGKSVILNNFFKGQKISSPLTLTGKVPTNWVFEAIFPVQVVDGNGQILWVGQARANIFDENDQPILPNVDFVVEVEYTPSSTLTGGVILEASNPSWLPENADYVKINITF